MLGGFPTIRLNRLRKGSMKKLKWHKSIIIISVVIVAVVIVAVVIIIIIVIVIIWST